MCVCVCVCVCVSGASRIGSLGGPGPTSPVLAFAVHILVLHAHVCLHNVY